MFTLERKIPIQAFHYIPADSVDLEERMEAFVQLERIARDTPALNVQTAGFGPKGERANQDEDPEGILTVVQSYFVAGEMRAIEHKLAPEDWLVQDHMVEGGWRVIAPSELARFLNGFLNA
jgi:hypothetical protein